VKLTEPCRKLGATKGRETPKRSTQPSRISISRRRAKDGAKCIIKARGETEKIGNDISKKREKDRIYPLGNVPQDVLISLRWAELKSPA